MKQMRYLITGGSGFIGSHLADRLLKQDHFVSVIDDLSTGNIENIQHLRDKPRFQFVVASILDESVLAGLIKDADAVFHLAAGVGVKLIIDEPISTMETNIYGTGLVLKYASEGRKPVLLTSTSEVYGRADTTPYAEESDCVYGPPTKSRWSYALSKAIDEHLALAFHKKRDLPVVIARLFNTAGPRQTGIYGMVIPRFARQALLGMPITVYGDGKQSRCFCHVSDVTRALAQLIQTSACMGQVYNVGSEDEVSMIDLAELMRRRAGTNAPIHLVPYEQVYTVDFEDMQRRRPSIAKIRAAIGFEPELSLERTIDDVIDSMKSKAAFGARNELEEIVSKHSEQPWRV